MDITVDFSSAGIAASQSKTFTVADRPNLVIGSLLVDTPGPYYPWDSFSANVRVDNIGGASAAANSISFAIGEASPSEYPVAPLSPGQSVWINRTMSAPTADSALTVVVNSNQNDGVEESQTDDNEQTTQLTIQSPPNFFHDESGILVDTSSSALTGPWILSGRYFVKAVQVLLVYLCSSSVLTMDHSSTSYRLNSLTVNLPRPGLPH